MQKNSEEKTIPKCVKATVIGRVQGVGFRYFTQEIARRYGIVGWVRNNYNGNVEIYAEGSDVTLQAFLKEIRKGPSASHVRNVNVQWQSAQNKYSSFVIRT